MSAPASPTSPSPASSYALLLLTGSPLSPVTWFLVPLFVSAAVFASAGMGLVVGGLSLGMRDPLLASNIAGYLLPLVCGVIAPIALLPVPAQVIFGWLPLTHMTNAARTIMSAGSASSAAFELLLGIALGGAWAAAGVAVWKVHERRIAREGASEQVL
ncbi:hypothetical protein D7252_05430 [Microbacterium sp. CGR2]|nr:MULTISPECIES: ABC transporter permease [unclassified Microbacterium]RKN67081.1 hypothetical protein D7252_05430 [Microbacterium sp. CGR2]